MTTQRDPFAGVKTVGDGRGGKKFAPDLPQISKERLIGVVVKLEDAVIVEDWDSQFGTSDFALVKLQMKDTTEYTCLLGGKAIVKAMRLSIKRREFPRLAVLDTAASMSSGNMYYYFRKPEADDKYELLPGGEGA